MQIPQIKGGFWWEDWDSWSERVNIILLSSAHSSLQYYIQVVPEHCYLLLWWLTGMSVSCAIRKKKKKELSFQFHWAYVQGSASLVTMFEPQSSMGDKMTWEICFCRQFHSTIILSLFHSWSMWNVNLVCLADMGRIGTVEWRLKWHTHLLIGYVWTGIIVMDLPLIESSVLFVEIPGWRHV